MQSCSFVYSCFTKCLFHIVTSELVYKYISSYTFCALLGPNRHWHRLVSEREPHRKRACFMSHFSILCSHCWMILWCRILCLFLVHDERWTTTVINGHGHRVSQRKNLTQIEMSQRVSEVNKKMVKWRRIKDTNEQLIVSRIASNIQRWGIESMLLMTMKEQKAKTTNRID